MDGYLLHLGRVSFSTAVDFPGWHTAHSTAMAELDRLEKQAQDESVPRSLKTLIEAEDRQYLSVKPPAQKERAVRWHDMPSKLRSEAMNRVHALLRRGRTSSTISWSVATKAGNSA
jgi:hypothetical protein